MKKKPEPLSVFSNPTTLTDEIDRLRAELAWRTEERDRYKTVLDATVIEVEEMRAELAEAKRDAEWYAAHLLSQAADALERAPRWRDVSDELPAEAQEVLFVRGGKTVHGAWIGGIFWHSGQKMAAAKWMPLPAAPVQEEGK